MLSLTSNAKYLGVIIDRKCQRKDQNKGICEKANNVSASFENIHLTLSQTYKGRSDNDLVKILLRYGYCVWNLTN